MSQSVPDLITAADQASTLIDDVNDRLHWMKRERPDDREDILAAADRAGRAWAETRLLLTMLRELDEDTPVPYVVSARPSRVVPTPRDVAERTGRV